MASSSAMTSFDSLPDELVLKIVTLAAAAEYCIMKINGRNAIAKCLYLHTSQNPLIQNKSLSHGKTFYLSFIMPQNSTLGVCLI